MNFENFFSIDDKSLNFDKKQIIKSCNHKDDPKNLPFEISSNKKTKETYFSNYKEFACDEKENMSFVCIKCNSDIRDCIYFCVNCEYFIHKKCIEGTCECLRCNESLSTIILEDSTLESSGFLKLLNTNINNLNNYKEFYDLSNKVDKEKYVSVLTSSLIKIKSHNNSNNKALIDGLKRTALSPISISTPYSVKNNYSNLVNLKKSEENKTPCNKKKMTDEIYYDQSPHISEIKQQLFNSPLKNNNEMEVINDQYCNFSVLNSFINNAGCYIYNDKEDSGNVNENSYKKYFTTTFINHKHKKRLEDSFAKDNFFKSLNFESNNILFENLNFKHDFKSLDFDCDNTNNETENDSIDKENNPSIPKDSTKFSFCENSPIEVTIEAAVSHLNSTDSKMYEVPILIEIKLKENQMLNYSKDYVLVFNSRNLSMDNVKNICILFSQKMKENDRIFTNIFKIDRWINRLDLYEIINNFENYMIVQENILNFPDLLNLTFFCIELANDLNTSDIFSIILINDLDELSINENYSSTLLQISEKIHDFKLKSYKNFTINSIILDKQSNNQQNLKFLSSIYDLSMLTLGCVFAPKNIAELNKCFHIILNILNQTGLINVKANIIGNKDPSVIIDVLNYPKNRLSHNNYEVYLGNLTRKEKKVFSLETKIFLSNPNIKMCLPLLELNFEINQPTKLNNSGQGVQKFLINPINLSIPLINVNKKLEISNKVYLRFTMSKVADILNESLDMLRNFNFEEALSKLILSKSNFEKLLKESSLQLYLNKLFDNLNSSLNSSTLTSSNISFSHFNSTDLKTYGSENISKILNFCILILNDINYLSEKVASKTNNYMTDYFISVDSLRFHRPTQLNDERFLDDIIDLN